MSVSSTWGISWQLVSGQLHLVERQATFCTPIPNVTGTRQETSIVFRVVWNVELLTGILLQSLGSVPGHILNSKKSTVRAQEHVQVAGSNDGVISVFNHTRKNAIDCGPYAGVAQSWIILGTTEDIGAGALLPLRTNWCIYGLLDVFTIEIHHLARGNVIADVNTA